MLLMLLLLLLLRQPIVSLLRLRPLLALPLLLLPLRCC